MSDNWITVATFHQHVLAALAKSVLDASGIECWLRDEHVELYGALAPSVFGGIKLQVRPEDVALAQQALQHDSEIAGDEFPAEPES